MKLTLRDLTQEERLLVKIVAEHLGISESWCLKNYLQKDILKERAKTCQA